MARSLVVGAVLFASLAACSGTDDADQVLCAKLRTTIDRDKCGDLGIRLLDVDMAVRQVTSRDRFTLRQLIDIKVEAVNGQKYAVTEVAAFEVYFEKYEGMKRAK